MIQLNQNGSNFVYSMVLFSLFPFIFCDHMFKDLAHDLIGIADENDAYY